AVGRADVHASVRRRGRRVELRVAEEARVGRAAPDAAAGARRERVDVPVVGADVDAVAADRDRSLHRAADVLPPDDVAVACVERIDVAEPVADVDALADDGGRRLARADVPAPAELAGADGERDDLTVACALRLARLPVQE